MDENQKEMEEINKRLDGKEREVQDKVEAILKSAMGKLVEDMKTDVLKGIQSHLAEFDKRIQTIEGYTMSLSVLCDFLVELMQQSGVITMTDEEIKAEIEKRATKLSEEFIKKVKEEQNAGQSNTEQDTSEGGDGNPS